MHISNKAILLGALLSATVLWSAGSVSASPLSTAAGGAAAVMQDDANLQPVQAPGRVRAGNRVGGPRVGGGRIGGPRVGVGRGGGPRVGFRGRGRGGWDPGAVAAGAIIGGVVGIMAEEAARQSYESSMQPAYDDAVAYCMRRFRSYNPATGFYMGLDGVPRPCP